MEREIAKEYETGLQIVHMVCVEHLKGTVLSLRQIGLCQASTLHMIQTTAGYQPFFALQAVPKSGKYACLIVKGTAGECNMVRTGTCRQQ